jgi:hypothetical protein
MVGHVAGELDAHRCISLRASTLVSEVQVRGGARVIAATALTPRCAFQPKPSGVQC